MSTYSARRRKRRDPVAIVMLIIPIIAIPALGYFGYQKLIVEQKLTQQVNAPVEARTAPAPLLDPNKMDEPEVAATNDKPVEEQDIDLRGQVDLRKGIREVEPLAMTNNNNGRGPRRFGDNNSFAGGNNFGGAGVNEGVDKIGKQLAEALELKKVLVIWLFDETSKSYAHDVAGKIESMYKSLGTKAAPAKVAEKGKEAEALDASPLLSVAVTYGAEPKFVTETPTTDVKEISAAAQGVSGSGSTANTFGAIHDAVEKFMEYRTKKQRIVSVVVVTESVGSDQKRIDEILPKLKMYQMPVNVIGQSAVFGKPSKPTEGTVSREPEWVSIGYTTVGGDDFANIDTGMGPYTLQRLCTETNGEYYAVSSGSLMGGNAAVMKRFAPAYVSEQEYQAQLQANKAKKALVDASKLAFAEVDGQTGVSVQNDDEVKKARALDMALRPAAKTQPHIDAIYNALKPGEKDVDQLSNVGPDARWKAGYSLAYGRACAAKARTDGFIAVVATLKAGKKFKNESSTLWVLEQTNEKTGQSAVDKMADTARKLLGNVVKDFPGTPWAAAAERELQTPIGWQWVER
jgi:hypothetical protein